MSQELINPDDQPTQVPSDGETFNDINARLCAKNIRRFEKECDKGVISGSEALAQSMHTMKVAADIQALQIKEAAKSDQMLAYMEAKDFAKALMRQVASAARHVASKFIIDPEKFMHEWGCAMDEAEE